ncbi:hypothetical protein [Alteribacillus bidgolensis]|uniref:Uncharacterized protein n=1 Tax=Alteribacillus bidgolensis TaxID=930129 RepID=A0A1G8H3I7_9BACI|nr:hypothetical protein [Alteribacillus bidgolensis]SDI01228.1 hypothetical protein SAMN05216352_10494 [Alteribacillus bidgolensis]
MASKGKFTAADYLSTRELRKAEYLRNKMLRSPSPRAAAIYEKQLKQLFQLAQNRKKQGKDEVNRKVKVKTPSSTAEFRNRNAEDAARRISGDFSRPKK